MTIKAIIFDYGNVLTFPQSKTEIKEISEILNVNISDLENAYHRFRDLYDSGKTDGVGYWKEVTGYLNLPEPDDKTMKKLIELDLSSWFHLNEKMWDLILKLREKYKIALLSNNIHELVDKIEKEIDLKKYFDVILFSNRLNCMKPDPEIYSLCIEKLSMNYNETVFTDDKIINITPAKELGINSILFTDYDNFVRELEIELGEKIC